jgi:hypothetical protein
MTLEIEISLSSGHDQKSAVKRGQSKKYFFFCEPFYCFSLGSLV